MLLIHGGEPDRRGGKRDGAGRKPSWITKKAQAIEDQAKVLEFYGRVVQGLENDFRITKTVPCAFFRFCYSSYREWPHRQGVSSHAEDARSSLVKAGPIYMYCAQVAIRRYCSVKSGGNGQLIGSTVSHSIVRSWPWSTATGSRPLGYLGNITASSW